ncbi:MAG: hypothetical protein R3A52_12455 [Polyangiales bacterium]
MAQVAMGLSSVCAVKRDGTVWCWGNDRLIPGGRSEVPAQTALTEVASITGLNGSWWVRSRDGAARVIANDAAFPAGAEVARNEWGFHACYRLPDATMRCEGANPSGVLGDGRSSGDLRARFAAVDPGLCGVQQIATGIDQSCALLVDGAVWCWGAGVFSPSSGLLEDCRGASTTTRCVPRPSRVAIDRVLHIAVGPSRNCAIRDDHSVWCWSAGDPARVDW